MEFLVHIAIELPPEMEPAERERLRDEEAERAARLAGEGTIKRLWRIPGRLANVGLWEATDATALDRALTSLPLWPWATVEVIALAAHPSDPGRAGSTGEVEDG